MQTETIQPTQNELRNMLKTLAASSTVKSDKLWAQAQLDGYTVPVTLTTVDYDLSLLVRDDVDLDSTFIAFDVEESVYLKVNGWLFTQEA